MSEGGEDDDVGYGRPPKTHRFKAGRSGNPRGRPKRSRNFVTELGAELDAPITIRENGREATMTKMAALAKSLVARALNGDIRAVTMLRAMLPDRFGLIFDDAKDTPLDEDEQAILERMMARRMTAHEARPANQAPENETNPTPTDGDPYG